MRHDVRDVILLRQNVDRATHGSGDVLAHRVHVLLGRLRLKNLIRRNLQGAEEQFLDLTRVIQLRHHGRPLHDRLNLGKPLRLREDRGVADGHHIQRPVEVRRVDLQPFNLGLHILFGQIGRVDAVEDLEAASHRVVQARMDAAEHDHTLLNQGHRRADRLVRVLVAQFLERSLHHTLTGIHQEAQKLKQRGARRVERHGHGKLANIVNKRPTLHLDHFGRLEVNRLTAGAALQLEQGRHVLDVRAV